MKIIIKREKLYEAIWREPMYKLSEKYNISTSKLKLICNYFNIPMPNNSYWQKLNSGKQPERKSLPEYNGENELIETISDWEIERKVELKKDPLESYGDDEKEIILKKCQSTKVNNEIKKLHPLVNLRNKKGKKYFYVYDIQESKEIKRRINIIYHTIFTVLEELGYNVINNGDKYSAVINEEEIPFKIREKAKIQNTEFNEREIIPSGILELKIFSYGKKDLWQDKKSKKLEDCIGDIIIELFYCASKNKKRKQEREEKEIKRKEQEQNEMLEKQRELLFRPNELKLLGDIGKKISKMNLGVSIGSNIRCEVLEDVIEKIILHINSFMRIVTISNIKEMDISTLASIARNIMECSNTYFYFAERNISEDEIMLRYFISDLHSYNNIIDIYNKLEYPKDNSKNQMLQLSKDVIINGIKENPIYIQLSKEEKSNVLNGNKAYLTKRQKKTTAILEKNLKSAIYNIFSNSIHSYHIGLGNGSWNYSLVHEDNYITTEMLLSLSIECCIIYTANVLKDYLNLRKKLNTYLSDEEKVFIKECAKIDKLVKWIDTKRNQFSKPIFSFLEDLNIEEKIIDFE